MFISVEFRRWTGVLACIFPWVCVGAAQASHAERPSARELVAQCQYFVDQPESADGQYCIRYIQGFVDGAVAADERTRRSVDPDSGGKGSLTDRAMRTRMPGRGSYERPAVGFCLGDKASLVEVADVVASDLATAELAYAFDAPAKLALEASLKRLYPCTE
ncbi:MAG: Rap1a/Tai family immunity protein [Pseudomonadota bacterium]